MIRIAILTLISFNLCFSQAAQSTLIKFEEFQIEFENFAAFDYDKVTKLFPDDMEFSADLGESLQGSIIRITSKRWENIQIEQKVETSVTIMDEGPHCDLVNWKHFASGWTKLKEKEKLRFEAIVYENGECTRFPNVDMKELQEAADKQCGREWANLAKHCKTPFDYPCGVSISRYFIRVSGTEINTGKRMERIITILIPMGC